MVPQTRWFAVLTSASLMASTQLGFAAEYYASPSGTGDGTSGSPFSLFQATSTAQAGDTVYLRGGIYTGTLRPANSGSSEAWITFAAYPGELPIFDGAGSGGTGVGSSTAQYIRFVGIVARNYSSTGFGNGWTSSSCSPASNGNLQFINVIAEGNGINGIAFYCASDVLVERSIVAHNGNREPSWSSGVNLFSVKGTASNNIVRQTVSFENIDISSNRSDGSGFILDQGSTGATFENNIGFRNGGSCIRLTNSPGSILVNNTCFDNGIDPNVLYHDEIFYSDPNSRSGALLRNTVAVASSGNAALWGETGVSLQNNVFVDDAGPADFFVRTNGLLDFNLTDDARQLIDQGSGTDPAMDAGFDPACLRQADGQTVSWWHYAIDYDYIESIGGVAACFAPRARSGALDIGAYEFVAGSDGTTATTATVTTTTTSTAATSTAATSTAATSTAATSTATTSTTATATTASSSTGSAATSTTATATTASSSTATTTATSTTATAASTTATSMDTVAATASSLATTSATSSAATTGAGSSGGGPTTDAGIGTGDTSGVGGAPSTGGATTMDASSDGAIGSLETSGAATGGAASGVTATNHGSASGASGLSGTLTTVASATLTTGGPGGEACQSSLLECGGECVDTASNPAHCGNCGVRCAAAEVCNAGFCSVSCAPGFTRCGQACVVLASDLSNCGACGFTCDLGQACQQGFCVVASTGESPTLPAKPGAQVYGDAGCGCSVVGGRVSRFGLLLGGLCALLALGRRRANGALYTSGTVRRY